MFEANERRRGSSCKSAMKRSDTDSSASSYEDSTPPPTVSSHLLSTLGPTITTGMLGPDGESDAIISSESEHDEEGLNCWLYYWHVMRGN